ncbi:unnamed protein product [Moneuplotes crassus]|uniref:Uncharacterized protein n=1 Tax=Euplotes crassus TaxID=5936 RepID=A0AAD1XI55_EUPCR|nr:unnamed protein product [Moneuplotes crassus]
MKVSLSSQNAYKMDFLNKVSLQQKGNKVKEAAPSKNFDIELEALQKLPKGTMYFGKMKSPALKQAINFAHRNNIQSDEYTETALDSGRRNIEDLLKTINDISCQDCNLPNYTSSGGICPSSVKNLKSLHGQGHMKNYRSKLHPISTHGSFKEIKTIGSSDLELHEKTAESALVPKSGYYFKKYKISSPKLHPDPVSLINKQIDQFNKRKLKREGKHRASVENHINLPSLELATPKKAKEKGFGFTFGNKSNNSQVCQNSKRRRSILMNLKKGKKDFFMPKLSCKNLGVPTLFNEKLS